MPLAGTWLMMALEGPYLAAIIARLDRPTENLAAFGIAFAFAIIIEAPVIMLLAASTTLVKDFTSYLALRRFTYKLGATLTLVQLVAVIPPIFQWIASDLMGLPSEVSRLAHHGLTIMLPWPIAIGYRRFRQGLLIRHGMTRRVVYGTALRLATMTATAAALAQVPNISGIYVGATALAIGVIVEAASSRIMTKQLVAQLNGEGSLTTDPLLVTQPAIRRFYFPLALTSVLAMAIQPTVTFFMAQSRDPLQSLAVLPVIHGLTFIFRAAGLSYQEVAIALVGNNWEHYRQLRNFGYALATGTAGGLGLIVCTPLATFWFQDISGLPPHLAKFAVLPAQILVLFPAWSVWMSFQRAILVHARLTTPVTWASSLEIGTVAVLLMVTIKTFSWSGAVAASTAVLLGRLIANLYLTAPVTRARQQPVKHQIVRN